MAEVILTGPAIPSDQHNVVLRRAELHSPATRYQSATDSYEVSVGIREGDYTTWLGSWDEATQGIEAGNPLSVLDEGREGMRLRAGQGLVVQVRVTNGSPLSLSGSSVLFTLGLVGGRDGPATPLVAAVADVPNPDVRVSLHALQKQVNEGGLSDWQESVQLFDPAALVAIGTFQGRLKCTSGTAITLNRYCGNWVEVDGEAVSIGASGIVCNTSDFLLTSGGGISASTVSASTLYYVYVSKGVRKPEMRLSVTSPTQVEGVYYLGSGSRPRKWRFCGWAYVDAALNFNDSETKREVINYYNREHLRLYACPSYLSDTNTTTVEGGTAGAWNPVLGTPDVSFIANGEDLVWLSCTLEAVNDHPPTWHGPGIGIDGTTDIETAGICYQTGTERVHISVPRVYAPTSAGRHVASLLYFFTVNTSTIYIDFGGSPATTDPALTFICGWVMG